MAQFVYRGPLIIESDIASESKNEFAIPNYATGMRLSPSRWLLVYDTVDCRGCDFWRSVLYQIRADAPHGRIVNSGIIAGLETHHRPFGESFPVWKGFGNPNVMGVGFTAAATGAESSPAAGIVAISYNSRCELWFKNVMVQPIPSCDWPSEISPQAWSDAMAHLGSPRLMRHYRFDPATDDLHPISEAQPTPANQSKVLGHDLFGLTNWGNPVAMDKLGLTWVEAVTNPRADSLLAMLQYRFDAKSRTFLVDGPGVEYQTPSDFRVGEPSLVRVHETQWILAARCFRNSGNTLLFRMTDPFAGLGEVQQLSTTYGQRMIYRLSDGTVCLLLNHKEHSPYQDRRNPLYCWRIDPQTLQPVSKDVVFDARLAGLSLHVPFVDHTHVFEPHQPGVQLMSFRVITEGHVWGRPGAPPLTPQEMQVGGIHCCDVIL